MNLDKTIQKTSPQELQTDVEPNGRTAYTPESDILETADSYVLDIYMPGVTEKGAEATLENDVLTIRGRVDVPNQQDLKLVYQEYEVGDYRRVFTLTDGVDRDRISATVRDGILHLVLPKSEGSKAKRIAIKAA